MNWILASDTQVPNHKCFCCLIFYLFFFLSLSLFIIGFILRFIHLTSLKRLFTFCFLVAQIPVKKPHNRFVCQPQNKFTTICLEIRERNRVKSWDTQSKFCDAKKVKKMWVELKALKLYDNNNNTKYPYTCQYWTVCFFIKNTNGELKWQNRTSYEIHSLSFSPISFFLTLSYILFPLFLISLAISSTDSSSSRTPPSKEQQNSTSGMTE